MTHFMLVFPVSFTDINKFYSNSDNFDMPIYFNKNRMTSIIFLIPKNFLGCYILTVIKNSNIRILGKKHKAKQLLSVIISTMTRQPTFIT